MYYRCIRLNTNQERNQVRVTIKNGAKNLSVMKNGAPDTIRWQSMLKNSAPDCPVYHRTVSGAPRPYNSEPATLGNTRARSAIIHRTVWCATGLSGEPAEQRLPTLQRSIDMMNSALQYRVRSQSAEVREHRTVRCS
jgi:hypothetical protein